MKLCVLFILCLDGLFNIILAGTASLAAQRVKASARNEGDAGSNPGSGISLGEGNGNPLQYSKLENPMDGEAS